MVGRLLGANHIWKYNHFKWLEEKDDGGHENEFLEGTTVNNIITLS